MGLTCTFLFWLLTDCDSLSPVLFSDQPSHQTSAQLSQQTSDDLDPLANYSMTSLRWQDLADSYLCSSGEAGDIRDVLQSFQPGSEWFVLVIGDDYGDAFSVHSWDQHGEVHTAYHKCQKNMLVWKYERWEYRP